MLSLNGNELTGREGEPFYPKAGRGRRPYAKVRYRGVAKNRQRIALLLGFSNLLIAGRYATQ